MAEKAFCSLSKDTSNSALTTDPQFKNLNLNQDHHGYVDINLIHSKYPSSGVHKTQNKAITVRNAALKGNISDNFSDDLQVKSNSNPKDQWSKTATQIPNDIQGSHEKEKKSENQENGSTLSLHISAFEENKVPANNNNTNMKAFKSREKFGLGESLKDIKQIGSEFPRQQKEGESTKPEVMQFKASQKLLNPNTGKCDSEFEKLKEKANKNFKEAKYKEAIEIYDEILQLPDLTSENQATIWSNKSASYLMLKDGEKSLEEAQKAAEESIKLMPNWWKGYYRFGRAQMELKDWKDAEKTFQKALSFNPSSKEVRDELSTVRSQIGILPQQDIHDPSLMDHLLKMGINEDVAKWRIKAANEMPIFKLFNQGNCYRYGIGVEKDSIKAIEFYKKAAEEGHPRAMYHMGEMYENGEGVERDYDISLYWFLKAANSQSIHMPGSGIPEAQFALGVKYYKGEGVVKNYRKAAEWYEKAAKNGCTTSTNNLGVIYREGFCGEKSPAKAFRYFKDAAEQGGSIEAMVNLADCYLNAIGTGSMIPSKEEIAEGMKWLKAAAEQGNETAAKEYERREKLIADNTLDLSSQVMDENQNDPLNYEKFGKCVEAAASKGSETAKRHMEIWKNLDLAMKAFKENDSAKLVSALSKAIHLCQNIVKVPSSFEKLINERFKNHPNELDAAVCYIHINTKNPNIIQVIQRYNKMFPDDIYLWEIAIAKNVKVGESAAEALIIAEMALMRHPTSQPLLYIKAVILQNIGNIKCIPLLDAYLAAAPVDDENVPACHYLKSQLYLNIDISKAAAFYEAGKSAEKKQLPCFLPYYFALKPMLEKFYDVYQTRNGVIPQAVPSLFTKGQQIGSDIQRIFLTLKRRALFINSVKESFVCDPSDIATLTIPFDSKLKPGPPNWLSAKKITGKDMDSSEDKVYNGYILEGRIIDWPILISTSTISTLFEDENGEIYRLAIFDWPLPKLRDSAIQEAIKIFRPNVKISIINPRCKKVSDEIRINGIIRIEGPEFVKLDASMIDKLCHVCGKEGKTLPKCSDCKMALYCSNECQKLDWAKMNHKDLCKSLKAFKQFM